MHVTGVSASYIKLRQIFDDGEHVKLDYAKSKQST